MAADLSSASGPDRVFNRLAEVLIQTLREMADRGEKLSPEALSASLADSSKLDGLIRAQPGEKPGRAVDPGRMNRLTRQNRELISRLEEAEERSSQKEDVSRKAILTLFRLSEDGRDEKLSEALARFKAALLEDVETEELEDRLREVKNLILKESPGGKKGGSGLGRLFKAGARAAEEIQEAALAKVRQTYLDILDEIDLDLGPEYMLRMAKVTQQIRGADDLDYLFSLKPGVIQLIQSYAHLVHEERQEAASFITQMALRLSEMESRLVVSLDQTREWARDESAFRTDFFSRIEEFAGKARRSSQLEELRRMVVTRLSSLRSVMEEKEKRDLTRIGRLENELEKLRRKIIETNREAEAANQENRDLLAKLSRDPLTGALNRRGLEERLASEMGRFQRYGRTWSLIMIDLDHFKNVNDTFGHPAGDAVLKELVVRLSPLLRKTDSLARYGGEEFAVLMPETGAEDAFEVAQKLRQAIEITEFLHRGRDVPVTISLGVSQAREKDLDAGSVIVRADQALYEAKKGGRNMVKIR